MFFKNKFYFCPHFEYINIIILFIRSQIYLKYLLMKNFTLPTAIATAISNLFAFRRIKMVPVLLFLMGAFLIGGKSWGQLVFNENCNAATSGTAATIATTSGGLGWSSFIGTASSNISVSNSSPLTYSGYNSAGGNYVNITGLTPGFSAGPSSTSVSSLTNSFYYSFLLKVPTGIGTGVDGSIAGLNGAATTNALFASLFIKYLSSSTYKLGISKLGSGPGTYGATTLSAGTTYLIVVRYSFTAGVDPIYLWVNPSLSSEPLTTAAEASVTTGTDVTAFTNSFGFYLRGAATGSITTPFSMDGLRVAYGSTSALAWTNLGAAAKNYYWNGGTTSALSSSWNTGPWYTTTSATTGGISWPSTGVQNVANFANSLGGTITMPASYNTTPSNTVIGANGYTFATAASIPSSFSSPIALGSYTLGLQPNATADLTLSGTISDTGGLNVDGGGDGTTLGGNLILSGTNTYTGATIVGATSKGQLKLTSSSAITASNITIKSGSQLILNGGATTYNNSGELKLNGFGIINGTNDGALYLGNGTSAASGTYTWSGNYTIETNSQINTRGGDLILSGNGTLTGDIVKNQGGTLIFAGTNTGAGGIEVDNGNLTVNSGSSIGTGLLAINTNTSTTTLNNAAQEIAGLSSMWNGAGTKVLTLVLGTGHTLTINPTTGVTNTFADGIGGTAVISGTGNLIKTGAGKQIFGGTNTYTGTTTINGGTLALAASGSIANSTGISLGTGATFDVSARTTTTLSSTTSFSSTSNGSNTTGTINLATGSTLTLSSSGLKFTSLGATCSTAPLTLSGTGGSLALNSSPITVTSTLSIGTYTLIAKGTTATVTGTPGTLTYTGTNGTSATVAVVSGQLILTVGSTLTTTTATNITATTATLAGNISSANGSTITADGIVYAAYATNSNPIIGGTGVTNAAASTTQTGAFSISATSLSVSTRYAYKAYATTAAGTFYGSASSFWTLANQPTAPSVALPTATSLAVTIGASDGNSATTTYAIYCFTALNYVQANGTLGSTPVYQTAATWGAVTVTGLTALTQYYFYTIAQNGAGVTTANSGYGAGTTTAVTAPTLTTTAAASITTTGATLAGNISSANGATVTADGIVYAVYATNSNPIIGGTGVTTTAASTVQSGAFSITPSTLSVNSRYSYNAYATNPAGTSYGVAGSFWTLANVPTAPIVGSATYTTLAVTIGASDNNPATTTYAIYCTTTSQYVQTNGALGSAAAYMTAALWGTMTVTGLSSGTSYSFYTIAQNGANIATGNSITASASTSAIAAPTLTTTAALNISATSATLAGNISSANGSTITADGIVYAAYATNSNPNIGGTGVTNTTASIVQTGLITIIAPSTLTVNTQYAYNAYATTAAGTFYGSASSFWTWANIPTTPTVGSPTSSTINVTIGASDGNPSITTYAIYCITTSQYVQADGTLSSTAVFQTATAWGTKTVTGFSSGTQYYFQIYAKNGAGVISSQSNFASATTTYAPIITTASPTGTVGSAFSYTILASNTPTSYALSIGSLPTGLTLNTTTGAITGTPSAVVTTSPTFTATNAYGTSYAIALNFTISKGNSSITATGTTIFTYNTSAQGPANATVTGSTGAVTYSYSGTGSTTYAATSTAPTAVGTYQVIATVAADTNYNSATSSSLAFTIGTATPVVTVTVGTYTFNASAQGPSAATNSGTGTSYTYSYVGVSGTSYTASATKPTNAGSYTATATVAANGNYGSASSSATAFTIGTATPVVTVTVGSYTYTGSAQGPSSVTGNTGSGTVTWSYVGVSGTSYTASATKPTNAGSYTATATVAANGNYGSASSSATAFTIGTATPVVTVTVGSYTYTGSAQGPSAVTGNTGSGTVTWSYVGVSGTSYTASATKPTNAGSYTATATVAANGNYGSASSSATAFTIGTATPVVTVTVGSYTYTGSAQGPSAATNTGTGTSYTYSYSGSGYGPTATAPTAAGSYTATATVAANGNYGTASSSATAFTIGTATPVVTVTVGTYTYTGSAQGPSAATNTGTGTSYTYSYSGSGYGPTATAPTAAGSYTATATVAANGNYGTASSSATAFTIGTATPVVTVTVGSYTYSGSAQGPSAVTGNTGSGTVTWSYVGVSGTSYTASATKPTNAGSYTATATVAANGNYGSASSSATAFTIGTATPVVTVTVGTYTYTGSAQGPSAATNTGTGTSYTYSYSGSGYGPTATAPTAAGSYTATATVAANGNYGTASSSATAFTIGTATPVVTVTVGTYTYTGSAQGPSAATNTGTGTSYTYSYSGSGYGPTATAPTAAGSYTATATVAANGNYGSASSSATAFTIGVGTTTWSATGWSNGTPNLSLNAIISYAYNVAANLSANSLTVNSSAVVEIPSGYNVTLNGAITVSSGSFTLDNNTNLLQLDASAVNTGNIAVNRKSAKIIRLDHTLWSSPVTGQNLRGFSPLTVPYRFYTYNTVTNLYDSSLITDATVFTPTKGFAIRAPNNYQTAPAIEWDGKFTGTPNNGTYTFPLAYVNDTIDINLVGNPYPSTIDANAFYDLNQNTIFGTFYFYQHTLTMDTSGLFPEGTNYASWTPVGGGTAATTGNTPSIAVAPSGIIEVGQGFLVRSKAAVNLTFNNDMRVASSTHQFIKSSSTVTTIEKHRMWLNLESATGSDLNQILVGYVTGATEGVDDGYDGLAYGGTGSSIYTPIDSNNYVIQCRSLPFNNADEVPLGFNCATAGTYSIKLSSVDGLFDGNQDIFIRDNLTGTDTNIKVAPYTFTSAAGTFDNRFKIVYTQALGVPSTTFNENSIIVYKNTDWFHVSTKGISMKDILVYDISGRLIYKLNNINDTTAVLKGLTTTKQVLFLKITSTENQSVTIKVLN